ncbi:MAG: hypothetical protein KDA28_03860, partial [Phycisphaerales bacterium]|nr:hypothetical protein [Phycisphaerales bacterium]
GAMSCLAGTSGCASSASAPAAAASQVEYRVTFVGVRPDRAARGSLQRLDELAREASAQAGRQRTEAALHEAIDRLDAQGAIVLLVRPRVAVREGARARMTFDHRGGDAEFETTTRATRVDDQTLQVSIDATLRTKGAVSSIEWGDLRASGTQITFVPTTLRPRVNDLDGKRVAATGSRITAPEGVRFYVFGSVN